MLARGASDDIEPDASRSARTRERILDAAAFVRHGAQAYDSPASAFATSDAGGAK
jgi:hypothetical protein